jgi:hypothetical protein
LFVINYLFLFLFFCWRKNQGGGLTSGLAATKEGKVAILLGFQSLPRKGSENPTSKKKKRRKKEKEEKKKRKEEMNESRRKKRFFKS